MVPMHGIGGRQDLPLPFSVVLVGAAVAVAASFLVLTIAWRSSRYAGRDAGIPLPRLTAIIDSVPLRWTVRVVGLAIAAWAGMALILGQDRLTNPIFGFVYVWVWVGLVPISLLFGPVWRTLNPLRSLHLIASKVLRHNPDQGLSHLRAGWGIWPAAVMLFGFVYLELVAPNRVTIPVLLLFVVSYVVVMLYGSFLFGQRWFAAADPFETYATLMAKLSPWGRNRDGLIVVRPPLINLSTLSPRPGTVAFVTILLGSTAYDGFSNSTAWVIWIQEQTLPTTLAATLALVTMIAVVTVTYVAAARLAGRLTRTPPAGQPNLFIHSLLPIALGYVVAHYLTLFLFEGQRTVQLWSDPLSLGWNAFGTAELGANYSLAMYPAVIAVTQAGAVVAGHIAGIIAAHDRALEVYPRARAVVGQIPMLIVMIGYTLGGLLLLFSQ